MITLFANRFKESLGPRALELPFAFENVVPGTILDIGQSNGVLLKELTDIGHDITVLDPNPEIKKRKYLKYVVEDIRKVLLKEIGRFDNILLISTLEHVGLGGYNQTIDWKENPWAEQKKALLRCRGMLKKEGRIILTVPYGIPAVNPQWQMFYTQGMLQEIRDKFNILKEEYITFSGNSPNGQKFFRCKPEDCANVNTKKPNTARGVVMMVLERQ